jgi:hypothetical protein
MVVARFFKHCLLQGGDTAASLGFVPLAPVARDAATSALETLSTDG